MENKFKKSLEEQMELLSEKLSGEDPQGVLQLAQAIALLNSIIHPFS